MSLISDLTAVADDILGVRDTVGANLYPIYIVTRTWSGAEPGLGTAVDVAVLMVPTPAVQDFSHKWQDLAGGNVQQGDLLLKYISKGAYPLESTVRLASTTRSVEKFYKINAHFYSVVSVTEKYIYWNVQIRKVAHT